VPKKLALRKKLRNLTLALRKKLRNLPFVGVRVGVTVSETNCAAQEAQESASQISIAGLLRKKLTNLHASLNLLAKSQ